MSLFDNKPSDQNNTSKGYRGAIVPDPLQQYNQKHKQAKTSKLSHSNLMNNGSLIGRLIKSVTRIGKNGQSLGDSQSHFSNTMITLLGYKALTHDRYHFLRLANTYNETTGYAEILRVCGVSISDLPDKMVKVILSRFINFLRAYLVDIEFISLPLPNNSIEQQREWTEVKDEVNQELISNRNIHTGQALSKQERLQLFSRQSMIKECLTQLQEVDMELKNRGFIMMIFDKNESQLAKDTRMAMKFGQASLHLQKMSVRDKEVFLTRLNNPNMGDE